ALVGGGAGTGGIPRAGPGPGGMGAQRGERRREPRTEEPAKALAQYPRTSRAALSSVLAPALCGVSVAVLRLDPEGLAGQQALLPERRTGLQVVHQEFAGA